MVSEQRKAYVGYKTAHKNYLDISIRNMYELEGKHTSEIASKLGIPEREVVLVLENHGLIG